jgi:Leucine-rich repeat (LRR) protein
MQNRNSDETGSRNALAPAQAKVLDELETILGKPLPLLDKIRWDVVGIQVEHEHIIGLGLVSCGLKELPASIGDLESLERLSLVNNYLKTLPDTIGNLKALKNLNLSTNKFSEFPASIAELRSLRTLILGVNHITSLPDTFSQLALLQTLWMNSNQLTTLPASFGELQSLQNLNFYHNRLLTLPESIGKLTTLRTLDLSNNQLTELPDSLGDIFSLQWIFLSGNQLTSLPYSLKKIHALEKLYINDNQLTTFPEELLQLRNLNTIRLSGNPWNQPEFIKQIMKNFAITRSIIDFIQSEQYHERLAKPKLDKLIETFLGQPFKKEINLFISYAMADSQRLNIPLIAKELMKKSSDINTIFWEGWDGFPDGNIIDYMEDNIVIADIFVPICTQSSNESRNCKKERDMAYFQNKAIIPIFESFQEVPPIFQPHKGLSIAGKSVSDIVESMYEQVMALVKKI